MLIELRSDDFEKAVSEGVVVVDFWAPWCGPCRMMEQVVEQFAQENPDIVVAKVNVDNDPELAGQYGVMSIPTLVFFHKGVLVDKSIGVVSKAVLQKKTNALVSG
ncbi:MAG: thioredoxin [Candidatus Cloacimonetes bacterium]|nr:thioredoxin [Candidatus Cloacimonadota bacterium]